MANQIVNHKCPSCTGPLAFNEGSQQVECPYCGSTFSIEEIESMYSEKESAASRAEDKPEDWEFAKNSGAWEEDAEGMRAYNCPSCGAGLICDEQTAATSCPYCGNPTILPGQFAGVMKPEYVIPFSISKEKAIESLKNHYKGKFFLPKVFADQNRIEEIKGIYVPFWLFDGRVEARGSYMCSRESSRVKSGNVTTITTKHYNVEREGSIEIRRLPVDASSKMPDDHMDSIEPYHYEDLKAFSTAYMPGYLADRYDVSSEDCSQRASARACRSGFDYLESSITGYSSVVATHKSAKLVKDKVSYALMPVWMLYTKWNGRDFLFAMNGQTGKFVGDLPVDENKYWGTFGAVCGTTFSLMMATGLWHKLGAWLIHLFA